MEHGAYKAKVVDLTPEWGIRLRVGLDGACGSLPIQNSLSCQPSRCSPCSIFAVNPSAVQLVNYPEMAGKEESWQEIPKTFN